jgi:hypothetical protein
MSAACCALTQDQQVAKLRLIVETAHDIWG